MLIIIKKIIFLIQIIIFLILILLIIIKKYFYINTFNYKKITIFITQIIIFRNLRPRTLSPDAGPKRIGS